MRIIKADKIFDGEQFIPFNAVIIEDGKIRDIIWIDEQDIHQYKNIEVYEGIIVPGFINTHCHLELSYLHQQFTPQCGMLGFLNQMFEKRNAFDKEQIVNAAEKWDQKMYENGIVAVGDIVNTDYTIEIKRKSKINYINFVEVFGLNKSYAGKIIQQAITLMKEYQKFNLNAQIVPHAPYSLSDGLWTNLFNFLDKQKDNCVSIHFLESREELNFIEGLASKMKNYFLNELKFSDADLIHISEKFYIYLKKILELSKKIILVHNTFMNKKYLSTIGHSKDKIFFCLCPRANLFIENQLPDINLIHNFSDQICLGTDSLASNRNLSIIDEINVILEHFNLNIKDVLKWATSNGAKALEIDDLYGYIKKDYSAHINIVVYKDNHLSHMVAIHED